MMEEVKMTKSENKKRPLLLTALCMFSFISSGAMALVSLLGIFVTGFFKDSIKSTFPVLDSMNNAFIVVMLLVVFILFALSLWGVLLMFRMRKKGFVLYVIPNGLKLLFLIIFYLSVFNNYALVFSLVSILMIVLYSTQIRHMKA
jgi:hypothetical protein